VHFQWTNFQKRRQHHRRRKIVHRNRQIRYKRIVTVDVNNPKPENWKISLPKQRMCYLHQQVAVISFANYMKDAVSLVKQYDYTGRVIREIKLPGVGRAVLVERKKEKNLYFSFTNYITPGSIFSLDTQGTSIMKNKVDFNTDLYESNKCFIPQRTDQNPNDYHPQKLKLDGTNPTMLYGWRIQCEFNTKFQYCQCRLDGKRRRLCHPTYVVVNTEKKWHDAGTKCKNKMYLMISLQQPNT
jgi:prolyl oligopeptidase